MADERGQLDLARSRARREARRRQIQRRRRTALGGLVTVAVIAAVGGVALSGGASSPGGASGATRAKHPKAAAKTTAAAKPAAAAPCPGPYRRERAPILEYHVIAPAPAGAPFPLLYVSPSLFAAQMHAIAAAGYHAVTLDQLWANWHEHKKLPCGKPIVISFDNGYETQFQYAEPVLAKLGWVGVENLQLTGLDWANGGISHHEIRELIRDGWELDTQGYDHSDMVTESASGLVFQTLDTRRRIQRLFHVPVNWFCYPSGQYDPTVIAELARAGFRGSTTEYYGWAGANDNPFALPRLEVHPTLDGPELVQQVAAMRDDPPPGDQYIS
jgi:peptidoglycan/xylan/chitin deacetylase (PgdA/CDA1 family)